MKYYVDFECFIVEADTPDAAEKKAVDRVKSGYIPQVVNIDECDDQSGDEYLGQNK